MSGIDRFTPNSRHVFRRLIQDFTTVTQRVDRDLDLVWFFREHIDTLAEAIDTLPVAEETIPMIHDDHTSAGTLSGLVGLTPLELAGVDLNDPAALASYADQVRDLGSTGERLRELGWHVTVNTLIGSPGLRFTLALDTFADAQEHADGAGEPEPLTWRGEDQSAGIVVADRPDLRRHWDGWPVVVVDQHSGRQQRACSKDEAIGFVHPIVTDHETVARTANELDDTYATLIAEWRAELDDGQLRTWYAPNPDALGHDRLMVSVQSEASVRARGYERGLAGRARNEETGLLAIVFQDGLDEALAATE